MKHIAALMLLLIGASGAVASPQPCLKALVDAALIENVRSAVLELIVTVTVQGSNKLR